MCVQYVIQEFLHGLQKKLFFPKTMVLIRKNSTVSHLNEISIYKTLVKTLMCILIKKTDFILFKI